jgi:hypothetical protein
VNRLVAGIVLFSAIAPATDKFFDKRVAPILIRRCLGCHNNELKDGDISFNDRDSLLKGGKRGPAVVPGKPDSSMLIQAIRGDADIKMPPGPPLPKREISILTEWIDRGAPWGEKLKPHQQ